MSLVETFPLKGVITATAYAVGIRALWGRSESDRPRRGGKGVSNWQQASELTAGLERNGEACSYCGEERSRELMRKTDRQKGAASACCGT